MDAIVGKCHVQRVTDKCLLTAECMSSSRTQKLIKSTELNINNCNSLKRLTAIAYTLC
jgi:hypothetical protein